MDSDEREIYRRLLVASRAIANWPQHILHCWGNAGTTAEADWHRSYDKFRAVQAQLNEHRATWCAIGDCLTVAARLACTPLLRSVNGEYFASAHHRTWDLAEQFVRDFIHVATDACGEVDITQTVDEDEVIYRQEPVYMFLSDFVARFSDELNLLTPLVKAELVTFRIEYQRELDDSKNVEMFPAELSKRIGCTPETLNRYVKRAEVPPPGRGEGNRKYKTLEIVKICNQFFAKGTPKHKGNAETLLGELQ
jgi:hypothetical protein